MKKLFPLIAFCVCGTVSLAPPASAAKKLPGDFAECATIQETTLATMPWHDMSYTSCKDGSSKLARPDFSNFASADDAAVGTKVEIGRVGTGENLCKKECKVQSKCNKWVCTSVIGGSNDCTYSTICDIVPPKGPKQPK